MWGEELGFRCVVRLVQCVGPDLEPCDCWRAQWKSCAVLENDEAQEQMIELENFVGQTREYEGRIVGFCMEKWTLRRQHLGKCRDDQKEYENIYNLYDEYYSREKHIEENGVEVYWNCKDEDLANKHTQNFLEESSPGMMQTMS